MIQMYDSIMENIPADAQAVAGYVGGYWPTFYAFERDFPRLKAQGRILSIAINSSEQARCLDIERGDAVPSQAPGWLRSRADRGHGLPVLYSSASETHLAIEACTNAGIPRNKYLVWSAHVASRHICGPHTCGYPQADGTQWTFTSMGLNLDASWLEDHFFASSPPAYPIDRFATGPFHVPKSWTSGKHPNLAKHPFLSERAVVENYRHLRAHPWQNRFALHVVRQELVFLRKRVWYEAQIHRLNGRPSWGVDWRGWRWQELMGMTRGVKAVV